MDQARYLADLYLLVQVIDAGGFSAAAKAMGTTRSLLSRRIIALEKALGTRLVFRNARHFAVTATGEAVYHHAVLMCDAAQAAIDATRTSEHGGSKLRISMCDALLPLMSGVLADFGEHYPQTQLSMSANDDTDALLEQHVDVILHLGHTLPDSSDIVANPLGQTRLVIVGKPELLQQLGHPGHPHDIKQQHRIGYTGCGLTADWKLRNTTPKTHPFHMESAHLEAILSAARSGMGLAQIPLFTCHEAIANGELEVTFTDWEPEAIPLDALHLAGHAPGEPPHQFIDFARERLAHRQSPGVVPHLSASCA